jgi:hypothetical protein
MDSIAEGPAGAIREDPRVIEAYRKRSVRSACR